MWNSNNYIYIAIDNKYYAIDKYDFSYSKILSKNIVMKILCKTLKHIFFEHNANEYFYHIVVYDDENDANHMCIYNFFSGKIYFMDKFEYDSLNQIYIVFFENKNNYIAYKELNRNKPVYYKIHESHNIYRYFKHRKYNFCTFDENTNIICFGHNENVDYWLIKSNHAHIDKQICITKFTNSKLIDIIDLHDYKFAFITKSQICIIDVNKEKIVCDYKAKGVNELNAIFPINKHQYILIHNLSSSNLRAREITSSHYVILSETLSVANYHDIEFQFV